MSDQGTASSSTTAAAGTGPLKAMISVSSPYDPSLTDSGVGDPCPGCGAKQTLKAALQALDKALGDAGKALGDAVRPILHAAVDFANDLAKQYPGGEKRFQQLGNAMAEGGSNIQHSPGGKLFGHMAAGAGFWVGAAGIPKNAPSPPGGTSPTGPKGLKGSVDEGMVDQAPSPTSSGGMTGGSPETPGGGGAATGAPGPGRPGSSSGGSPAGESPRPYRHKQGFFGEIEAQRALQSRGHDVLIGDTQIGDVTKKGFDIVTIKDGTVYLVDNKAFLRDGNISSVSSLTTNFGKNLQATIAELETLAADATRPGQQLFQQAADALRQGNYVKAVTNFAFSPEGKVPSGITSNLTQKQITFIDLTP